MRALAWLGSFVAAPEAEPERSPQGEEVRWINPNSEGTTLMHAVLQENIDSVRACISQRANVNEVYNVLSVTCTPLAKAAENCSLEVARALVVAKADVNQVVQLDNWNGTSRIPMGTGRPPLHWAVTGASASGSAKLVEFLLHARADLNWKSDKGTTALMRAAEAAREDVLRILLAARADVHQADEAGETALFRAVRFRAAESLAALLAASASVNVTSTAGATPLALAARIGSPKTLTMLLEARSAVDVAGSNGKTPLLSAIEDGARPEIVLLLVGARADAREAIDACDGLPGIARRVCRSDAEGAAKLLERLAAALAPWQEPGWSALERIAGLFAPRARAPLRAWARTTVAFSRLRARQPSRAELRAALGADRAPRFVLVGPQRVWRGRLTGCRPPRLVAEWDGDAGPEFSDEFLGESLFVLDDGEVAFDGGELEEHLLRRERERAGWTETSRVIQEQLDRRPELRDHLWTDPWQAAARLEAAALSELLRRVWPARKIADAVAPPVACALVRSEPPADCDDALGAAALLCAVAGVLQPEDLPSEGVEPPDGWPSASALAAACGQQLGLRAGPAAEPPETPGPITSAFAASWAALAPPAVTRRPLPLDVRERRARLVQALAKRLGEVGAGGLAACTADSLEALRLDCCGDREPERLPACGEEVVAVVPSVGADCGFAVRRCALRGVLSPGVFAARLQAEGDEAQEEVALASSGFGLQWFSAEAFERASWRRPEVALLRAIWYRALVKEVFDALLTAAGDVELDDAEHAEALVFDRLWRMRELARAGHSVPEADAGEEEVSRQALDDLAVLHLGVGSLDDLLGEGADEAAADASPSQSAPPAAWAVPAGVGDSVVGSPIASASGDAASVDFEEGEEASFPRPRFLLDDVARDALLGELAARCAAGPRAAPPESPAGPKMMRRFSTDSGQPAFLSRRFTSMSSGVWSDAPASPLFASVPLSPAVAVQQLSERMTELGLEPLPESELLARMRLAHWSVEEVLSDVVDAQ